jgi:hypothetical protein
MKFHFVKTRMSVAIARVVSAGVIVACGAAGTSRDTAGTREIATARRQVDDHMTECTKRYGYDPEAGAKLGSNVLGPGEREWRVASIRGLKST